MRTQRKIRPVEIAVVSAAVVVAALSLVRSVSRTESAEELAAPRTFRVAAVQMYSRMGDLTYNRARMATLARRAAAKGADVIVFPEAAVTGYVSEGFEVWTDPRRNPGQGRSLQGYSEPVDGKSVQVFSKLSRELGVYIVVPFVEYDRDQKKYYNTLVLVGPGGKVRAHYRKLHPWLPAENTWASKGNRGLVWADTEFGRLGLLICYDMHWVGEQLAEEGADTLLYSVAWVGPPQQWFAGQLMERAGRFKVNIVAANWTFPREPEFSGAGWSRVIGADGKAPAATERVIGEEIVVADLPLPARVRSLKPPRP